MMTPAEFDDRLIDFEDAVIERERTPEFGRSLLAAKLALQEGIEAEYKKVYDLARELAAVLRQVAHGYAPHPDGRPLHVVVSDVLEKAHAAGIGER